MHNTKPPLAIRSLFLLTGSLLAASHVEAALVTAHTDTTAGSPLIDGSIAADEYGPGNAYAFTGGGSGFGGQLGPATLYMKSDAEHLYLGFSGLGIPGDGNQYLLYLDTRPGGFQTDGSMDDVSDGGRANVTRLARDGDETVTLHDGEDRAPDFALLFNNQVGGFSALFELAGAGSSHGLVSHQVSPLGSGTVEFRVKLTDLGIASAGTLRFAAFEISADGFLANEGLPDPGLAGNPGYNTGGTLAFTNAHRFQVRGHTFTGILQRTANTTLKMPPTIPAPTTNSYTTVNAFPGLAFNNPMLVAVAPGETNRLYVGERTGNIMVITNLLLPSSTLFMTVPGVNPTFEGGLLGLAFHPDYTSNRQFFVFYTCTATNGTGTGFHTRLSRFERDPVNPNAALPGSEVVLFSQFNSQANHNAGDIHFGVDGYLYVATGDEGGSNDNQNNSQRIDKDFFAGLLRIDVDKKPGSLPPTHHPAQGGATNYAIPPDNPFVGYTNTSYYGTAVNPAAVRTEFFATGLRNPFRFHIDKVANLIYVADVGQNLWEEVNLVTNGGNYGWAAREGFTSGPKNFGLPASAYANPILAYGHGSATNQGNSITGGVVYRGDRFPELVGRYIYADYQSGNIWALTHDGTTNTSNPRIASDGSLVGFGIDPTNGDVLMCDLTGNQVKRLVYATQGTNALPSTLSGTGIFADLGTLTPYEGIVPYTINLPFWSDNAVKSRWFSLPDTNLLFTFNPDGAWTSPASTVWVKHFELALTSGVPESARRIETRVLVRNDSGSGGYGVTYRWGTSTNDAMLVPDGGLDEEILINDSGIIRTQVWRYPSRAECLACHLPAAGFALSFNTPQMHVPNDFGDTVTNQIAAFAQAGYFANEPGSLNRLRKLAHPSDESVSLTYRVKSYLQANCATCHAPGGSSPGAFDARLFTALASAGIIDGLLNDDGGNPSNRVVVRGQPGHSMLLERLTFRGAGQMPPIGSNLIDTQAIALVTAWINGEAASYETFGEWQVRHFGSMVDPDAQPGADPDDDGSDNLTEYHTRTQPTNALDRWNFNVDTANQPPAVTFTRVANTSFEVQASTNLVDGAWEPLDTAANAPAWNAADAPAVVPDTAGTNSGERYYRVNLTVP